MSDSGRFDYHVEELCKNVCKRIGWVCKTFYSRYINFVRRVCKVVINHKLNTVPKYGSKVGALLWINGKIAVLPYKTYSKDSTLEL